MGVFCASYDRRTGSVLVKVPADRVEELIATGRAEAFAPAGRRFKEWAAIPPRQRGSWKPLLDEALTFARQPG